MSPLRKKIDFAFIVTVNNANPNGDPLNGNRPRYNFDNFGEISDVCLKRKIRNRLLDEGHGIFVQSDDRKTDSATCLKARAESGLGEKIFKDKSVTNEQILNLACAKWLDVRAFGQLFAFSGAKGKKAEDAEDDGHKKADGVSVPIRGPVSVRPAFSVAPVSVTSTQITKSVSGESDGGKKGSDTMGLKHRVDYGVYVAFGSMNPQLAERTGFSDDDAEAIRKILPSLFENDASSARPEGSMAVSHVFWWEQEAGDVKYSSAKVHGSLTVAEDGSFTINESATPGLQPMIIEGF